MVPFINSDQMRQEEKITEGCFQITKRNVNLKFKFLDINGHRLIFQLSVKCFRNYNCFQFNSRLFFVWHEHFARDLYLRMETICALWDKYLVRLYVTDSFVRGRMYYRRVRKVGYR